MTEEEELDEVGIDQIHCVGCGRPMIVRCDVELTEERRTCSRCRAGLPPDWEY